MSHDLPVPVAVLAVAAVLGLLCIGVALAVCCYFCFPARSCWLPKKNHRVSISHYRKTKCGWCFQGRVDVPVTHAYSPTPSEVEKGFVLVEPYNIPVPSQPPPPQIQPVPVPVAVPMQNSNHSQMPVQQQQQQQQQYHQRQVVQAELSPAQQVQRHGDGDIYFTKELTPIVANSIPQHIVFHCQLNHDNVNTEWTRNGFPVDPRRGKQEQDGRNHRLVFGKCDPNDQGYYECLVAGDSSIKTGASLDFKTVPTLKIDDYKGKTTEIPVGHTAYFHLPFTGQPLPQIDVFYNGTKPIPDANRMTLDKGQDGVAIFTVSNAVRSDTGTYRVIAENESGKAVGDLKLSVLGKLFRNEC